VNWGSGGTISVGASGEANGFKVSVKFDGKHQFLFGQVERRQAQIDDKKILEDEILERVGRTWNRDWCVVTEILTAKQAFLLISKKNGASVDFTVDKKIGNTAIALAKAQAEVHLKNNSYVDADHTGLQDIIAGFTLHKVVKPTFRDPELKQLRVLLKRAGSLGGALIFGKVG
jgi:hypothetical protein